MATENQPGDPATGTEEISDQQNDGTETPGQGETPPADQNQSQEPSGQEEPPAQQEPQKDSQKASLLADLHKERKDRQSAQSEVATLKSQVAELTTKAETVDAIQGKYDRLTEFLKQAGGQLGRALDSLSFTQSLFETDKPVEDIVADWNRANPSATSQALGAGAANPAAKGPSMNDLLRSAAK